MLELKHIKRMRHFYLYAKGWYKRGAMCKDLEALGKEYVSAEVGYRCVVLNLLGPEVLKLMAHNPCLFAAHRFFEDLSPHDLLGSKMEECYYERLAKTAFMRMQWLGNEDVDGKLHELLGDPDPELLPLKER